MGKERDELNRAEKGKQMGLISTIGTVIVCAAKVISMVSGKIDKSEDMRERDKLDNKWFKSKEDKEKIREIDNKYSK